MLEAIDAVGQCSADEQAIDDAPASVLQDNDFLRRARLVIPVISFVSDCLWIAIRPSSATVR